VSERDEVHRKAQAFFEDLWRRGDPWELEASGYERARTERLLELLAGRRYARALEIGCGAGHLSVRLAGLADHVLALDISEAAIARARERSAGSGSIEYRVANVMEVDVAAGGPWDLVVMSETIYYLGWLYPFFDVAWLAHQLFSATAAGGRALLANTSADVGDALMLPWLIRTYHDLFVNVGYQVERAETFRGEKHGVAFEVAISLMRKG
jgi:SAM-dependent methyltransferase